MSLPHSSLPELMEKKKRVDMHTNIATALLDEIKVSLIWLFTTVQNYVLH